MSAALPEVSVELREGEYVAQRGTCKITWLVRLNDAWVHVSEWPAVEVERCETKSGVVWENLTRLSVAPGARLLRVESRPAPYAARDALDYLKRSPGVARRVIRQEFRVGRRGDLRRFDPNA
ncbi:MAG: hypothetical protein EOO73_35650 [Myxococcales bacterium]|nr:MAG: hypothetical protein EOO73_35650 [Myxococcales bacterium]